MELIETSSSTGWTRIDRGVVFKIDYTLLVIIAAATFYNKKIKLIKNKKSRLGFVNKRKRIFSIIFSRGIYIFY